MHKAVGDSRVKDGSDASTLKLPEYQCEECVPVTVSYRLLFRQYLFLAFQTKVNGASNTKVLGSIPRECMS